MNGTNLIEYFIVLHYQDEIVPGSVGLLFELNPFGLEYL